MGRGLATTAAKRPHCDDTIDTNDENMKDQ